MLEKNKNRGNAEDFREEAERLALADRKAQQLHISMLREIGANPKVPKEDRALAIERADSLENHLKRIRKKNKNNS